MLASVTLLPALLGFVGRNIDRLSLPHRKHDPATAKDSGWERWSHLIQRRPWPAAIIGLARAARCSRCRCCRCASASPTPATGPTADTTRRSYDLIAQGFGPGFNGPLLLAAETPNGAADVAAMNELAAKLNETKGVAFATPPQANAEGTVAIMQVFPTTDPQAKATADLVNHLRDDVIPAVVGNRVDVKVGGLTAAADDFASYTAARLPIFIGAVLILSFLLLMVVFRSLLVPLKAVIMNLLSIGAAYGVVVAVFQWGWGASLIGVGREAPVEAWAPVFIFAIVFGLSMDYEVFLLSRIREEYDRTGDNADRGGRRPRADRTGDHRRRARSCSACSAASCSAPRSRSKLMGLGLAVAVLIDATIVRMVLVPATMELLGDWNWWLPKWLDRILPRVHVEGAHTLEEELAELEAETQATPVG